MSSAFNTIIDALPADLPTAIFALVVIWWVALEIRDF